METVSVDGLLQKRAPDNKNDRPKISLLRFLVLCLVFDLGHHSSYAASGKTIHETNSIVLAYRFSVYRDGAGGCPAAGYWILQNRSSPNPCRGLPLGRIRFRWSNLDDRSVVLCCGVYDNGEPTGRPNT